MATPRPPFKCLSKASPQPTFSNSTYLPLIMPEHDYYHDKLAFAVSIGHDPIFNIQRREFVWYTVWDLVLNHYFLQTKLFISPQWPVWRSNNLDTESELTGTTAVSGKKKQESEPDGNSALDSLCALCLLVQHAKLNTNFGLVSIAEVLSRPQITAYSPIGRQSSYAPLISYLMTMKGR